MHDILLIGCDSVISDIRLLFQVNGYKRFDHFINNVFLSTVTTLRKHNVYRNNRENLVNTFRKEMEIFYPRYTIGQDNNDGYSNICRQASEPVFFLLLDKLFELGLIREEENGECFKGEKITLMPNNMIGIYYRR